MGSAKGIVARSWSTLKPMDFPSQTRLDAAAALDEVARTRGLVRRHSANSGRLPLLWGALLFLLLSLFEVLPHYEAAYLLAGTIVVGTPLTVWHNYASRKVEGRREARVENSVLMVCWMAYFLTIYWFWSPNSAAVGDHPWLAFGLFAAAPLLIGGGAMWLRGR